MTVEVASALPDLIQLAFLVAAAYMTALLSAVAGFGGGVLLLPVFVAAFGPRDAVVVLTIAQLASNAGRVWFNRFEIERRLVAVFAAGAVPAAVAGALLLAAMSLPALIRIIGAFLLAMVIFRHLRPDATALPDGAFAVVGAASGFGSALVGSVGPLVAPFFLARGLVRGAYIGTDAAASLTVHLTKVVVFGLAAVLTAETLLIGLALIPSTVAGAWTGKKIVDRLPVRVFILVVETCLVIAGLSLLIAGKMIGS